MQVRIDAWAMRALSSLSVSNNAVIPHRHAIDIGDPQRKVDAQQYFTV